MLQFLEQPLLSLLNFLLLLLHLLSLLIEISIALLISLFNYFLKEVVVLRVVKLHSSTKTDSIATLYVSF